MMKWDFDIVKQINRSAAVKKEKVVECPFCKSEDVQCIGIDIAGEEIKKSFLQKLFPHGDTASNDVYKWHCQKCGSVFEKGDDVEGQELLKCGLLIVILVCIYGVFLSL